MAIRDEEVMPLIGTVAALLAAAAGAAAWALLIHFTGFESGWVAWGIGAVVGFGSALFGGRGAANGVLCAVLTVVSIAGGRVAYMYADHNATVAEVTEVVELQTTQENYDQMRAEAQEYALVKVDSQLRAFMVHNRYTEATVPNQVTDEDLSNFRSEEGALLRRMTEEGLTYEEWSIARGTFLRDVLIEDFDPVAQLRDTLQLWDAVFILLGVVTAFQIGSGKRDDEDEAARSDAAAEPNSQPRNDPPAS